MADLSFIRQDESVKARFWSRVDRQSPDECWPWRGYINAAGYGRLCVSGKEVRAHRVAVILDGRDIPDDMVVDHICRRRDCVNPSHLRVVTHRINAIENSASIPAINAVKTHCPHGHEFTPENTRMGRHGNGRLQRQCKTCAQRAQERYRRKNPHRHRMGCAAVLQGEIR